MAKSMTAEEILPLVAGMTPRERGRLLRLIAGSPSSSAVAAYTAVPPGLDEFSSDDDSLEWDAEGWGVFD
jgi:hypothetical protein